MTLLLFNNSKYTKWYFCLVEKAGQRDCYEQIEKHHILPISLGGDNHTNNIVTLTPREHYIAHLLLTKMCVSPKHIRSMSYAFHAMSRASRNHNRYNSRLYEIHKNIHCRMISGSGNPMWGVPRTEEWKKHFRKQRANWNTNTTQSLEVKRQRWLSVNPNSNPEYKRKGIEKRCKTYLLTDPDGMSYRVQNLANFCRERKLHHGNLISLMRGRVKYCKGWSCQYAETA